MDLKVYEITSQRTLVGIPAESLSSESYQGATHRWLDVEGGSPEALRELLAPFDLHPLVMDACTEPGVAGHFASFEKELYIEFSVLSGGSNPHLTRVSIICLPTTLLTIHNGSVPSMVALIDDLADALQTIQGATQRFEASLSDLHQQYVLTQQDKMNSRLHILTVISAVFLPLTLLAGIYGMNFVGMPELQWPYGYPVVIGLMAVIVAVMLYVFYRRGWFK